MAKERSDQGTETQRPTPSRARRGKQPSDTLPQVPDREIQDTGTSDDQGNPEWWRGDPGKRGEVL